jgi:uncharacterized glyoxalase superfamily protein PhnB
VEFKLNTIARLSVADEARTTVKSSYGSGVTIGLQVEDVETTRSQLMEAGLRPTEIKKVWGTKVFYIHDPEGNRIEFWAGQAHI